MKSKTSPAHRNERNKSLSRDVDPSTPLEGFPLVEFLLSLSSRNQSSLADRFRHHVQKGEWRELCALAIDPRGYSDRDDFARDYLLTSVVKKYQDFKIPGLDRQALAFEKWLKAEESCRNVNHFFRSFWSGDFSFPPRVVEMLYLAQCKIQKILGDVDYDFVRENCRFGPGSDLSTDGQFTASYNKYRTPGSATPGILPVFSELFSEDRREDYLHECEFVRDSRLSFVPKTAVIDRSICVEPRWNVFTQLGIGELIVKRLRRSGIDLKDQTRNQELARLAHAYGLATIDLSSASDCISKNLVLHLLPEEWSDLIFKTRCPSTLYRGKRYELEKVSSMGNGYTFPLESLIFFALAESAADFCGEPRLVGTFGDDLVVTDAVYPVLADLLCWVGFDVNPSKSFRAGHFHESCGKDYFKGENVRPFFMKKKVSSVLDHYVLANQIVEYSHRLPAVSQALDLMSVRQMVIDRIPEKARLFGPMGLAGVLHSSFDECNPKPASQEFGMDGWEGWAIRIWSAKPKRFRGNHFEAHLFTKLRDDVDLGNDFTTRGQVIWKKKVTYVPTYADFVWV